MVENGVAEELQGRRREYFQDLRTGNAAYGSVVVSVHVLDDRLRLDD